MWRKTPDGILVTKVAPAVGKAVGKQAQQAWKAGKEPTGQDIVDHLVEMLERQKSRYATRMIANRHTGQLLAYAYMHLDRKYLSVILTTAQRMNLERFLWFGARGGSRIIPVVGWAVLAKDLMYLGDLLQQKYGKDPQQRALPRARRNTR